jgi:hypothetical protein
MNILTTPPPCPGLPGVHQQLALEAAPRGSRKVVVATNIAETSLTIQVSDKDVGICSGVDVCLETSPPHASAVEQGG